MASGGVHTVRDFLSGGDGRADSRRPAVVTPSSVEANMRGEINSIT